LSGMTGREDPGASIPYWQEGTTREAKESKKVGSQTSRQVNLLLRGCFCYFFFFFSFMLVCYDCCRADHDD